MNELTGYLVTLNNASKKHNELMLMMERGEEEYSEAFSPLLDTVKEEDLKKIFDACKGEEQFPVADVFVAICLILYAPESLYQGKLDKSLAKKIAGVLGQTFNNVYLIRTKVSTWIRSYRDFLRAIEVVYAKIIGS